MSTQPSGDRMNPFRFASPILAAVLALPLAGCLGFGGGDDEADAESHWVGTAPIAEETAPLAGAALEQRKDRLVKAQRDLAHFNTTLESLHFRDDRFGTGTMTRFADAYLSMHVDRLLAHEWQSRHPEVAVVDANLRLAKADILVQMHHKDRAADVLDELERRFERRNDLLVEYPLGTQRSLGEAIKLLRDRT
jgi:hypothetical protein